ncbi:molybdopterin-guanine dinucleotide biosynthesis protein MobB region [Thermocrinis albus DSM 14484]|uniref:Molybdopterin-guanine dinucleotide biosynthesis protein MobB region n=1 Tax=Thermocrinis albus (strain DSM 14484 / JCM 11386 / HI 11/12) TaxID=638303 RepID=D3SLH0_THEAH|nr:molybdopterin-guanine dinucleotide biosynthesis protein MobB [Thermocrinis albus]ADC89600.1 molybdopterin-guanine dinucleotide biosynthesis protein MobB region [Thermocrinis albus DSM 14484]
MPELVFIVGFHNSGKTTLAEKLAVELTKMGFKVGYIKHDPKGHAVTDKEGSDSFRMFQLLDKVAVVSPQRTTFYERREDDPISLVQEYFKDCQIVLLEGWKFIPGYKRISTSPQLDGFPAYSKTLEEVIAFVLAK